MKKKFLARAALKKFSFSDLRRILESINLIILRHVYRIYELWLSGPKAKLGFFIKFTSVLV